MHAIEKKIQPGSYAHAAGKGESLVSQGLGKTMIICIAGVFLFPFLWPLHSLPIPSFYNEWASALLMLLAGAAGVFLASRDRSRTAYAFPVIALLFAFLAIVILAQLALGKFTYSSNAIFPLMTLSLAAAAAAIGAFSVNRFGLDKLLFWISIAAVAGGLFNFLLQVVQLCTLNEVPVVGIRFQTTGSFYGSLGQQNHLATYLNWCLIATLYLYWRRSVGPWVTILLATVLLIGMALTTSRMTWLQIPCIAIAGTLLVWRMEPSARPRHWRMLAALPVLYLSVTLVLPYILELAQLSTIRSPLLRLATEEVGGARKLLLRQAWEIFLANPTLGVGAGEFNYQQFLLLDREETTLFASSSHNLLLDLLAMTGLAGMLVFLVILVPSLYRMLAARLSLEAVCLALMLSVLGIHALLEYPELYAYFLLPAAFMLGALETRFVQVRRSLWSRTLPAIAMVYGIALSAVLLAQYSQLEQLYARHYVKNRLVNAVDSNAVAAIEEFYHSTLFAGPAEYLLCFNFYLNEIALDRKLAISQRALRYMAEPNIVYRHVVLLALAGRQEEGIAHLLRLKKVSPKGFDEIAVELRSLGLSQPAQFGKIASALDQLAPADL